jgi:hypothetical protein
MFRLKIVVYIRLTLIKTNLVLGGVLVVSSFWLFYVCTAHHHVHTDKSYGQTGEWERLRGNAT